MAFVKKIETETGIIGIWEINESVDSLLNDYQFSEIEEKEFSQIALEKRQKEYLTSRIILKKLLGFNSDLIYEETGKPKLNNSNLYVSISHSAEFVVAFISERRVGIDVENLERNIEKIAHRFLHKTELDFIKKGEHQKKQKTTIWSAKEAIFKCSVKQGILFNKQIIIDPFEIEENGMIYGQCIEEEHSEYFNLNYFYYKNNVVVYCVEKEYSLL